ncbi:MAG: putative NADP-dependent oxidoreductase YfmJ [Alphaproteobacteria bacterium MarineAlpha2_Bin1]|nr:MAG: putative NADP-dependent oxidoreductase YfmJ [Alphaproteobacteria bacterium MarineAlpha2_Bin1]
MKNTKIVLSSYPLGMPTEENFRIDETEIPNLKDKEFLVKTSYLSVDPFLRMLMNPSDESNAPSRDEGPITDLGQVMAGGNLGKVIQSKNKKYPEGSIVEGMLGWQSYPISNGWVNKRHNPAGVVICNSSLNVPISAFASILGRAGLTAFFCVTRELKPKKNDTVVISAAAGAGGSLAGQIAKKFGSYVVGICGSDAKVEYITKKLGFDIGINYKKDNIDLYSELKKVCPKGVDVHYDNVGGEIMQTITKLHNPGYRYRLVGIISEYNSIPKNKDFWSWPYEKPMFVVHDYTNEYEIGIETLSNWIKNDEIKYHEDIIEGIENTPKAFIGMLNGDNIGKRLIKI